MPSNLKQFSLLIFTQMLTGIFNKINIKISSTITILIAQSTSDIPHILIILSNQSKLNQISAQSMLTSYYDFNQKFCQDLIYSLDQMQILYFLKEQYTLSQIVLKGMLF